MNSATLFSMALDLQAPWHVEDISFISDESQSKVSGFMMLYHDFLKGQPETYQVIFLNISGGYSIAENPGNGV